MLNFEILFEDGSVIVVAKPAGLMVEADRFGNPSLEEEIARYFKEKRVSQNTIIGIVHRLDRPVSGVMIIAKKRSVLKELNDQFEKGLVDKTYFATVEGKPAKQEAHLQHYLRKDSNLKKAIIYRNKQHDTAKCELIYKEIKSDKNTSLLEVHPLTGKYHQIRAQLSFIGCPIVGDVKYNSKIKYKPDSICLHSQSVEFFHPVEKKK